MTSTQFTADLGLNAQEGAVYLALLELGPSTVLPIAKLANLKRTSIYNFIAEMVSAGILTSYERNNRRYYVAEPPEKLLNMQRGKVARLEEALPQLMSLYNSSSQKARIQYLEGPEQVKKIVFEELQCKKEALYIWSGKTTMEMIGGVRTMNFVDAERIKRGVWVRTIRYRRQDVAFKTSAHGKKYLRDMRYAPEGMHFAMTVGIYDTGKVGLFGSTAEGFGILIESTEYAQLMKTLFELYWRICEPARSGEG